MKNLFILACIALAIVAIFAILTPVIPSISDILGIPAEVLGGI